MQVRFCNLLGIRMSHAWVRRAELETRPDWPIYQCEHCRAAVELRAIGKKSVDEWLAEYPEQCSTPKRALPAHATATGPGSWLKRLLGWLRITEDPGCGCGSRAREMDARGCWWCLTHCWTIAGWLAEAGAERWPRARRWRIGLRGAGVGMVLVAVAAVSVLHGMRSLKSFCRVRNSDRANRHK